VDSTIPATVLFSVRHVAELLGISTRQVYRLSDAGKMPRPIKLGGMVRWLKSELDEWLIDRCRPVRA
jgi:excisionase family DNA binding protein